MLRFLLVFVICSLSGIYIKIFAQEDTITIKKLEEVVVTATRSERELSSLPLPLTVISQIQIKAMGSLRLTDVLQEQTGLAIVNDHGNGIQLQGFGADYTLILIDGEPLIGRTAGTFDLSRIAIGNIKQIEVVKGPSSSLYGSEALAGVINIITEKPNGLKGNLSSRYGTNGTMDFAGSLSLKQNKLGIYAFANRWATQGYDLTPEVFGKTVEPYTNYTFNTKLTYDFSSRTQFSVAGRYFTEKQTSAFAIGTDEYVNGWGKVRDWNLNPVLLHRFGEKLKMQFRFYATRYHTQSELNYQTDGTVYDASYFTQQFLRPEIQAEYYWNDRNILTFGGGRIWESVEATRYTEKKHFQTNYAFAQYEWQATKKLNVIIGSRLDAHSVYGTQLNPKISAQYELKKGFNLHTSIGRGFKAPDFRQLYLNFTNAVAGYSVFGTEELPNAIANLIVQGSFEGYAGGVNLSQFTNLKAESSTAYNLGIKISPKPKWNLNVNLFRNDIQDLIESQLVGYKSGGQQIFSYRNFSRVLTQGLEWDFTYRLFTNISLSVGYQLLYAKDKDALQKLKNGEITRTYRLDPNDVSTTVTEALKTSDYVGLYNRSRHMANFKIFYENSKNGIIASLRGIYRGKYGLDDSNSNAILDKYDQTFVQGYWLWNLAFAKTFYKSLRLQVGCDNILNQRNLLIPNIAGRLLWMSVSLNLEKNKKN